MQSWRYLRKLCNGEPQTRRQPRPLGLQMGNHERSSRTCIRLKVPHHNRLVAVVELDSWIKGPRWWWARGSSHKPLKTRWNPQLPLWNPQLRLLPSSRSPRSRFSTINRTNIVWARTWARWWLNVAQSSPKIAGSRLHQFRLGPSRVTEQKPLVSWIKIIITSPATPPLWLWGVTRPHSGTLA